MPKTFAADTGQTALIPQPEPTAAEPAAKTVGGKLGVIVELLRRPQGAEIADMMTATGWQPHSVRGALAGALKHRGFKISSEKLDGPRVYRIVDGATLAAPAAADEPAKTRKARAKAVVPAKAAGRPPKKTKAAKPVRAAKADAAGKRARGMADA